MILDTSFIIDLMNRDEGAVKKLEELTRRGETQLITVVSIFELYSGVVQSKKPVEEREKVIKRLEGQTILHLERISAEKAGEIDGALIKSGEMIEPTDSMIAGIALTKGEKVLTRNIKDFKKVRGLVVEEY